MQLKKNQTMARLKKYDKRFLPMLWIGIVIWTLSAIASYLMAGNASESSQTSLMEIAKAAYQQLPIFTLILLCVLGPVLEEFSFRLWGIGKTWAVMLCLILMILFCTGELGWWTLLLVGLFLFFWLTLKNRLVQQWLLAIISSVAFTLCHISGFGTFGVDMIIGLSNIFGLALVLCWLTINFSFFWACLLHTANNAVAIILPLLLTPQPATNTHTTNNGAVITTQICSAVREADMPNDSSNTSTATFFCPAQEPSQLATNLINDIRHTLGTENSEPYYCWISRHESIEDRICYQVKWNRSDSVNTANILECYIKDYEAYSGNALTYDTTMAELMEINLLYTKDSSILNINDSTVPSQDIYITESRMGNSNMMMITHGDSIRHMYAIQTPKPKSYLDTSGLKDWMSMAYPFQIQYKPTGRFVQLISIK